MEFSELAPGAEAWAEAEEVWQVPSRSQLLGSLSGHLGDLGPGPTPSGNTGPGVMGEPRVHAHWQLGVPRTANCEQILSSWA